MNVEKTLRSLCRNYCMEGKTKRTLKIWETLEKEIPQLDHLLEIRGKEQITSFLGFYFQRKLLSQIGKEVAPANS